MKITLSNLKTRIRQYNHNQLKLISTQNRTFSTTPSSINGINQSHDNIKTSLYMWMSSVIPGRKKEDYSNRFSFSRNPIKLEFFEGKNPTQVFSGPRHHGVITEDGNLYTFGDGYRGVLGHGNDMSIPFNRPKLVSYFAENKIKVKKILFGDSHSMALSEDGDLYTWGYGGKLRAFFSFYKGICLH
jgi:hypothetical protein